MIIRGGVGIGKSGRLYIEEDDVATERANYVSIRKSYLT